jgi:type I restriction enzyme R subunit
MAFNENTRVKIPAILHLTRLGYQYASLKDAVWEKETNIFTDIFGESIRRINFNYGSERYAPLLHREKTRQNIRSGKRRKSSRRFMQ